MDLVFRFTITARGDVYKRQMFLFEHRTEYERVHTLALVIQSRTLVDLVLRTETGNFVTLHCGISSSRTFEVPLSVLHTRSAIIHQPWTIFSLWRNFLFAFITHNYSAIYNLGHLLQQVDSTRCTASLVWIPFSTLTNSINSPSIDTTKQSIFR